MQRATKSDALNRLNIGLIWVVRMDYDLAEFTEVVEEDDDEILRGLTSPFLA